MSSFVPLKLLSNYSLLEGMLKPKDIVRLCLKHQLPAFAVTDNGNLFGAMELSCAAAEHGLQPIMACSLAVAFPQSQDHHHPTKLSFYVKNQQGWQNLIRLVTRAHEAHILEDSPTEQVTWDEVTENHEGLMVLSGGREGALHSYLAEGDSKKGDSWVEMVKDVFGNRFYLELNRHGYKDEQRVEPFLFHYADHHAIPLVACQQALYESDRSVIAHEVLLHIAQKTTLSEQEARALVARHAFPTRKFMQKTFADCEESLTQSLHLARRCSWFLQQAENPRLPSLGSNEELRALAEKGLEQRLAKKKIDSAKRKIYEERIAYELSIIQTAHYSGYMLILTEFIAWARKQDIAVGPGRGSGAGSLVAWALSITDIDPLQFGLLFERFLNPERISMPDVDIDFCGERRDEVIAHVREKYGEDKVAHIITFGALKCRAAIRDAGRVLGYSHFQVNGIVRHFPIDPKATIADAFKQDKALKEKIKQDRDAQKILAIAEQIEGLYRHTSTHAAGVVIGDQPLQEIVPLSFDRDHGGRLTQWTMESVEKAGLIKFDFLGLKILTMLQAARDLLQHEGVTVDFTDLPLDDAPSYELLTRGDTSGIFQLESDGMRSMLRELKPDCFEDIIAAVALYRPGPMDQIPTFIARKHGRQKISYPAPQLESLLKDTYGVVVYQEQVMKMAEILAGYSLGSADILRRAIGKKKKEDMGEQRQSFVQGAVERGLDQGKAERIFEDMAKFAGYGFNKSHATAYAMVAYQTTWLKAHHPEIFFAAAMSIDYGSPEKCAFFRSAAQRMDIVIVPPSINQSEALFQIGLKDGKKVIPYALAAIRHVGLEAAKIIVQDRHDHGDFKSLNDFLKRLSPQILNKRLLESFIKAGVLDEFIPSRRWAHENVDGWRKFIAHCHETKQSAQGGLFNDDVLSVSMDGSEITEEWTKSERIKCEMEILGFYLSGHPLATFDEFLTAHNIKNISELMDTTTDGKIVTIAGIINSVTHRTTKDKKNPKPFAFVSCSDRGGDYEVAFFGEVFSRYRAQLKVGVLCLMKVKKIRKGDMVRWNVRKFKFLTEEVVSEHDNISAKKDMLAQFSLHLTIDSLEGLRAVKNMIASMSPGKSDIYLIVNDDDNHQNRYRLPDCYAISNKDLQNLRTTRGVTVMAANSDS